MNRTAVMGERSLHCANRHFGRFRLLWPWPWPDDLHCLEIYTGCANMNFLCQGCRKLSSDRHTYIITYIQTDEQNRPKLYITPLRGWSTGR